MPGCLQLRPRNNFTLSYKRERQSGVRFPLKKLSHNPSIIIMKSQLVRCFGFDTTIFVQFQCRKATITL
jgi:hypothetical protein